MDHPANKQWAAILGTGIGLGAMNNERIGCHLADAKYQLLKKRNEAMSFASTAERYSDSEYEAGVGEESAAMLVVVALPEERPRILELLAQLSPPMNF